MPGPNTQFLQDTVGSVVAQGCSVVASVKPSDPVEYLGLWLLQYVRNAQIEGDVLKERGDAAVEERTIREKEAKVQKDAQQRIDQRDLALKTLSLSTESGEVQTPVELWNLAIKLVTELTTAKSAYVAAVIGQEDPDAELEEEDNETDDEQDRTDLEGKPAEGEQEEDNAEKDKNEAEVPVESEEVQEPVPPLQFNYENKFLQYVVGSKSQEFIQQGNYELHRPFRANEGDEEESQKKTALPPTFRIFDDRRPSVYIQSCLTEDGIHFLRKIPRVGSYFGCALQSELGECKALLGCDTLIPAGDGGPLCEEDRDFIWKVAQIVGRLSDTLEAQVMNRGSAKDAIDNLRAEICELHNATEEAPNESDEPKDPETTEVESDPAEAKEEEVVDDDEIKALKEAIGTSQKELDEAQASCLQAETDMDKQMKVLDLIKSKISDFKEQAISGLRCFISPPRATFKVLKSALYMIGWPAASFKNWTTCRQSISEKMFNAILEHDSSGVRDPEVWKIVRKAYKSVIDIWALESELPDTCMGILLLMLIRQTRRVARRSVIISESKAVLTEKKGQLSAKEAELEEKLKEREAKKVAEEEQGDSQQADEQEAGKEEPT